MLKVKVISCILGATTGFTLLGYSSIMSTPLNDGITAFSDFMIIIFTVYAAMDIFEKIVLLCIKHMAS